LVEGLFAASASGEAFEGGDSDCGEEAHDANDGEKFDEGEGGLLTPRSQRSERGEGVKG
jgi:hypothetical protein